MAVKWRQFSQSNRHSTIGTRQTEYREALPSSANDEVRCDCTFADDGNASWYSVCRVPMVEWRLDYENCRHLTIVGLHDTGPWLPNVSGMDVLRQLHLLSLWNRSCSLFVGWLLNVPATCQCISRTDLLRQFYVLPHWDRSCRPNFPSHPVTAYWHRADQSQHWSYNARRLAG